MNIRIQVLSAQARREIARLQGDIARLNAASAAGAAAGGRMGIATAGNLRGMRNFGNQLQWTGRQLQYNWTLPILAAAAAGAHFQLENERAMTRVAKVYGEAGMKASVLKNELKSLEGAFEALSEKYGIVQSETIQIAADWAAAGSSGIALAKATDLTMKTMVLGQLEAAESTQALIAIQAQYNQSTDELADTIARLNNVENQTGTTMGDLIVSMSRSAGVARAAGIDVAHLAAMTAALVPAAGSAAQAGNALKTIISRLLAPTGEAAALLNELGIATDEHAWKSANATTRIQTLTEKYQGLADSQKAQVATTLASRYQINKFEILLDAVARKGDAAGNGMSFYWKALEAATNRTEYLSQVTKELDTVLESNPKKWDRIKVVLQNTLANAVQPILPWLIALGQGLANIFRGWQDLSPVTQKWIGIVLLGLVVLPLLVRYIGSLITLIATFASILYILLQPLGLVIVLLWRMITAIKVGTAVAWLFGAAWAALAFAFGLFAKAIPAIVAFLKIMPGLLLLAATGMLRLAGFIAAAGPVIMGAWRILWTNMLLFVGVAMSQLPRLVMAGFGAVLAAIAVVLGPISRLILTWIPVIGAAIVRGWTWIVYAIGTIQGFFVRTVMVTWVALSQTLPATMAVLGTAMIAVWNTIHFSILFLTMTFGPMLARAWTNIGTALVKLWGIISRGVLAAYAAMGRALFIASWAIYEGMILAWAAISKGLLAAQWAIYEGLLLVWTTLARVLPIIWGATWTALTFIVTTAGPLLITLVRTIGTAIVAALMSPWTWLILAVAAALYAMRDKIVSIATGIWTWLVDLFDSVVERIISAFNALPQGVQNAFMAVIHFIRDAAMQVAEWLSYLNPFARHSPSLVDNVNAGMAAVVSGYGQITAIKGPVDSAANSLGNFKQAAAGLSAAFDAMETAKDRQLIAEFAPGLLGQYDQMNRNLTVMKGRMDALNGAVKAQERVVDMWKDRLDAANDALDRQRDILDGLEEVADGYRDRIGALNDEIDRLASTPIKGMGAMEDALFANEMAQKRLRLEMLRAGEDGGQSFEDIRNKLSLLSGEIENLTGRREELRGMGAGSEILSHYDQQIAALDAQRDALEDAEAPVNHLQQQLDELQRKAEIMDLEKALKFDPLTRAIDKAANSMQELPFDSIIGKIRSNQATIDSLTPAYNRATAAVNAQEQAVKRAQAAVDAIQSAHDAEAKKLERIRDLYQETADAVREMEGALQSASGAASGLKSARDDAAGGEGYVSPAIQNFRDAAGGNFADVGGSGMVGREMPEIEDQSGLIDDFTQQIADEAGAAFGDIDMFGPLRDMWDDFYAWAKGWLTKIWGVISDFFGNLFEGFDPMAPLRDSIGGFGDEIGAFFTGFWDTIVDVVSTVWDIAGMLWDLFGPDVMELFGTIWDFLSRLWTDIGEIFSDLGERLAPFWEALNNIWTIIKPIVLAILAGFMAIGEVAFEIFNNVLGPVLDWVGDMFMNLWEIIRGVIDIFIGLFTLDFGRLFSGLGDVFAGLGGIIWDTITGLGEVIWGALSGLVGGVFDAAMWIGHMIWEGLEEGLRSIGLGWLVDIFGGIIDWVKDLFGISSPSTVFAEIGGWLFEGLAQGLQAVWPIIEKIFTVAFEIITSILEAIGPIVVWLAEKIVIPLFTAMGEIIGWLWDNVIEPLVPVVVKAFQVIGDIITWLYRNIAKPLFEAMGTAFEVLGTGIMMVWNGLIKPAWDAIKILVELLWNVMKVIFKAISDAWKVMADLIKAIWQGNLKGVWEAVKGGVDILWNALKTIFELIGKAWDALGGVFRAVYNNFIKPIIDAFKSLIQTLKDSFQTAVDTITRIWEGLKNALMTPVQWVIDFVWNNGLRKLWNWINNLWGGDDLAVFKLARGGIWGGDSIRGTEGATGLAKGGVMPGYSPGRDIHNFVSPTGGRLALSGGEAVMRPEFTRAVGSGWVKTMNAAARSGGAAAVGKAMSGGQWYNEGRAYAAGGVIDPPGWLEAAVGIIPTGGILLQSYVDAVNSPGGSGYGLGLWSDALVGTVKKVGTGIWDAAKSLFESSSNITGGEFEKNASGWPARQMGVVSQNVANSIMALRYAFPQITSVGTVGSRPNASDHPWGKAADFMIPGWDTTAGVALGNKVANTLMSRSLADGLNYVIWNDKISSGSGWEAYTHPNGATTNPTLRHLDHVHASYYDDGGLWKPGSMGINRATAPERVLNPRQTQAFERMVGFLDREGVPSVDRLEAAMFRVEARINGNATIGQQTIIGHQGDNNVHITFNGDLVFPNIESGDDAKVLLRNLGDLAGRR